MTVNFGYFTNSGSSESLIIADVGSIYGDKLTGDIYKKVTGTGDTGWEILGGTPPSAFIGFKATKTLTASPVTGAGELYTYTNYVESFDEGNVFNPTTGIFTAPEAAKFQFNVIANYQVINVSTSGFAQFNVTNAGGLPNQYFFVGNPINMRQGNGQLVLNGSALMDLPTNANVSLSVQFSGGLPTTRVSIIEFSAFKIG